MVKAIVHPQLAKRLRYACDQLGLPVEGEGRQRDVANGVGCTQEAARKWLKGYTRPSHKFVELLAKFLQIDVGWLEYGSEPVTIQKRRRGIATNELMDGAFYLVYASFRLKGIPVVEAKEDEPHDLALFNRGAQFLVSVALAEMLESDKQYRVNVKRDLEEGTVTVIVVPHTEFGVADQIPLCYHDLKKLGKAKGNYWEILLERSGRHYKIKGKNIESKLMVNRTFV